MAEIHEYFSVAGISPYERWFVRLDHQAAAKVTIALVRLAAGNTSKVKAIGSGVAEIKIDFGPGYRVYFGWDGPELIILLGGGTKKFQDRDIALAHERWRDYKVRKRGDTCH